MKIPSSIASIIQVAAPTLALALAGPLGPLAAGVVSAALRQWLPVGENDKATPDQVVSAVQAHANDPALMVALRKAEADLKKAELELGISFARLELQDREGARAFARDTGSAPRVYKLGWAILVADGTVTLMTLVGGFLLLTGTITITDQNLVLAVFTLIGAIIGRISARADTFVNFVFGSSEGSKEKTATMGEAVEDLGLALRDRPAPAPHPAPVIVAPPPLIDPPSIQEEPLRQGPFGGQRWRLTPRGVVLEGDKDPLRTVGQPVTVRRIWKDFGPMISTACATHGVPLELVVATIATESRGVAKAKLVEPDAQASLGLMQLLTGTAETVAGRPVSADELYDPATNIDLGTRYIAWQRRTTDYQPPLVAAAYNAGSLHKARPQDDNAFNLRSTGDHIHRFCQYFGDACAVASEDGWSQTNIALGESTHADPHRRTRRQDLRTQAVRHRAEQHPNHLGPQSAHRRHPPGHDQDGRHSVRGLVGLRQLAARLPVVPRRWRQPRGERPGRGGGHRPDPRGRRQGQSLRVHRSGKQGLHLRSGQPGGGVRRRRAAAHRQRGALHAQMGLGVNQERFTAVAHSGVNTAAYHQRYRDYGIRVVRFFIPCGFESWQIHPNSGNASEISGYLDSVDACLDSGMPVVHLDATDVIGSWQIYQENANGDKIGVQTGNMNAVDG